MKKNIIYGLVDPNTKELRYIGYTSYPIKRYSDHHINVNGKTHKINWIKSLISKGQKAEMIIIEEYQTAEELPQAEIEMIAYFKSIGCNLTNATIGGDGGATMKGKKLSKEHIEKMKLVNLGRKMSKESKEKMRLAKLGKKVIFSKSHKENLSKSLKGKIVSEVTKLKLSISSKDKHRNIATEFKKGRIRSQQEIDKTILANTIFFTEEQKTEIINMYESGVSFRKIAPFFNVSRETIRKFINGRNK